MIPLKEWVTLLTNAELVEHLVRLTQKIHINKHFTASDWQRLLVIEAHLADLGADKSILLQTRHHDAAHRKDVSV